MSARHALKAGRLDICTLNLTRDVGGSVEGLSPQTTSVGSTACCRPIYRCFQYVPDIDLFWGDHAQSPDPKAHWVHALSQVYTSWRKSCIKQCKAFAGGIPEKAQLVAEAPQHWRPPPSFREGHSGKAPQVGQVAGVAKGHQGTVWVFHRYLPAHEYNTVQCMYI